MRSFFCWLSFFLLGSCSCLAHHVDIDISGGAKNRINLLIPTFENVNLLTKDPRYIVVDDLEKSAFFRVGRSGFKEGIATAIDTSMWKSRGFDAVVRATVKKLDTNRFEIDFTVYDINQERYLISKGFSFSVDQTDRVSHLIADQIYRAFLGIDGYFSSRLALVLEKNGAYEIRVVDVNGKNGKVFFKSSEPILSPKWSPDSSKLAFVSFEKKKPTVNLIDVVSGKRSVLADHKGSNSSPSWLPDGKRLLVVLTKDGFSDIYSLAGEGSYPALIIHSRSIDTEPVCSGDGKYIFFTSDRDGSPQIYRYGVGNKSVERVTFHGEYNVSPALSPDGQYLSYVGRLDGKGYVVMLMNLLTGEFWPLTSGPNDESPIFSPNGQLVMYVANMGEAARVVSLFGEERYEIRFRDHKIITPSWSNKIDG